MSNENREERSQPKTPEWFEGQANELTDLRKKIFHLCKDIDKNKNDDEYFPDKVIKILKELLKENKNLKSEVEKIKRLEEELIKIKKNPRKERS